jgi:alkyl hydroperoxide reductase subunit D
LSETQKASAFLAAAFACGEPRSIAALMAEYSPRLTPAGLRAAKAATAIMSMTNVYWRFLHLVSAPEFKQMPTKLKMSGVARPGTEPLDFEAATVAVSALNGCTLCVEAHLKKLLSAGGSHLQAQAAVRIAAVVHAIANVLRSEAALAEALPAAR